jgi:uncharacterized membrane protein
MQKITREDIYQFNQHSSIKKEIIDRALHENVYAKEGEWIRFLKYIFIALGIGFTVTGIIFFFAYNWENLDKTFKLILVQGILIISVLFYLFSKKNELIKKITITGSSVLVGVMFAVFGQIYQTGANSFDLFILWTLLILPWVIVSKFSPLWFIFYVLCNTSFILFKEQYAVYWSEQTFLFYYIILQSIFAIPCIYLTEYKHKNQDFKWTNYLFSIGLIITTTIGCCYSVFSDDFTNNLLIFSISIILFSSGIFYGFKTKNIFYIMTLLFGISIVLDSILLKVSDDSSMISFISIFIILSVTFILKTGIDLQKKWKYGKL